MSIFLRPDQNGVYRVMLSKKSADVPECLIGDFIGPGLCITPLTEQPQIAAKVERLMAFVETE